MHVDRRDRAFSLIELAVVIGILGLLLAVGIPQFVRYKQEQKLRSAKDTILSDLATARTDAKNAAPTAAPSGGGGGGAQSASSGSVQLPTLSHLGYEEFPIVGGTPQTSVRSQSLDSDVTISITGGGDPATALTNATTAVIFQASDGTQSALGFQQNGAISNAASPITVTLSNATLQFSFTVSKLGDLSPAVQSTPGPVVTASPAP